jgi:hypothetical protein
VNTFEDIFISHKNKQLYLDQKNANKEKKLAKKEAINL